MLGDPLVKAGKVFGGPLVKAGKVFGRTDGVSFDDSKLDGFTCTHYLSGIYSYPAGSDLETYSFRYSSSQANQKPTYSRIPDYEYVFDDSLFEFGKDDRISKVQGQIINKTFVSDNGTSFTIPIITGLQFTSKSGIGNPLYRGPLGENFTEDIAGYTLGYVTGRTGQYIEQLQFYWYRT